MLTFFDLPFEIRDYIYRLHYRSLVLTCGYEQDDETEGVPKTSKLGLLRTCRSIHREVKEIWLGLVEFEFANSRKMLDRLAPLSPLQRSAIRRICVLGEDMYFFLPDFSSANDSQAGICYTLRIETALIFLADLQLDVLTVDHRQMPLSDYEEIGYKLWLSLLRLIESSQGFSQLHFYPSRFAVKDLVAVKRSSNALLPMLRPEVWKRELAKRDGLESGAVVHASRISAGVEPPRLLTPIDDEEYGQLLEYEWNSSAHAKTSIADPESHKSLLIIAKRGANADYRSKPDIDAPYMERSCAVVLGEARAAHLTWEKIRETEEHYLRPARATGKSVVVLDWDERRMPVIRRRVDQRKDMLVTEMCCCLLGL